MFIANTPVIRVKVYSEFLGKPAGTLEEGYLVAVTSISSRPLFFTVHLESGALWQRLPINAISCERFDAKLTMEPLELEIAQPFSCLEGDINVIEYNHLKNYEVEIKVDNKLETGYYLFTVDVAGPGLSEDPVQHKSHNVIVLECGRLVAVPNNHCLFKDRYFTKSLDTSYKRVDKYYVAGG